MLKQVTHDVSDFQVGGPVTLSLSKGRAGRPLPAMVRQAHHDSLFYDVILPSESMDFTTQDDFLLNNKALANVKFARALL